MHLQSFAIEGFRGIDSINLKNLGRVTLLAGKNSVGKSTILEAIRVFASRGDVHTLTNLLRVRGEMIPAKDDDGDDVSFPNFSSLFHERMPSSEKRFAPVIKLRADPDVRKLSLHLKDDPDHKNGYSETEVPKILDVSFGDYQQKIPLSALIRFSRARFPKRWLMARDENLSQNQPDSIVLESLGPSLPNSEKIANLWDNLVLTEAEEDVIETLRLVVGNELQRLAVIADPIYRGRDRRVIAKLKSTLSPIPLKRLGDGAQRLLGISLALANCPDGILLIDEVENGFHYSIQLDLWRMIFKAAQSGNIQVFAATHSWDCLSSFATAALETTEEGSLIRLDRTKDGLRAISYTEEELGIASKQKIEVR